MRTFFISLSSISAIPLPQFFFSQTIRLSQNFFSYFDNTIATINLSQIFFPPISTIPLPQFFFFLFSHNFSNGTAEIGKLFFPTFSAIQLPFSLLFIYFYLFLILLYFSFLFFFFSYLRQRYCRNPFLLSFPQFQQWHCRN